MDRETICIQGYYADPEATARVFDKDGYFLTGDLGSICDNKVYIKGRKDSMLVLSNGENVSSRRIAEKIKSADPRISSVKVFMREGDLVCDIYVSSLRHYYTFTKNTCHKKQVFGSFLRISGK